MFQITEDDLAELERLLPEVADAVSFGTEPGASPRIRTQLNRVKTILSNVRWNYGPPSEVERIDP
jgi:hypothetical protein